MTPEERWLGAIWPGVREWLPPPPARVLDLGCGSLGGLVPRLSDDGYEAVGVDPRAPDGEQYRRVPFEQLEPLPELHAVVASASLHHVHDPARVFDRVAGVLAPGGRLVVVEWDWEAFDEKTAEWCFRRLGPDEGSGWLHRHRDRWSESGRRWKDYLESWAVEEGIHPAATLVRLIEERYDVEHRAAGAYLFADLPGTTEDEERAAIARGEIRATRVDLVGRQR
jgi:SAM-dependent methyltransferase